MDSKYKKLLSFIEDIERLQCDFRNEEKNEINNNIIKNLDSVIIILDNTIQKMYNNFK